MAANRLITRGIVLLLLLGAMLWPACYNGQPFFFPDTTAYLRGADAGMQKLTGHATPWSAPAEAPTTPSVGSVGVGSVGVGSVSVSSVTDKTVLAGRSPYYGLLLYLGAINLGPITGGFWLSVSVQAGLMLAAIALTLRAAGTMPMTGMAPWPVLPGIGIVLAAATTLPWFASFLMPDLFAGVAILGAAVLLAVRARLPRAHYAGWGVLLAMALSVHDSHALIAAAMLALAVLANLRRGWGNWRGLTVLGLALLAAAAAQLAFTIAVTRLVGAAPLHPPFLMARLIEDGPGMRYLTATCPDDGFAVCQFLDRLPLAADDFLWATGQPAGVFAAATPALRRRLAGEQVRFLFAVLAYDPAGVAIAALRDAGAQLAMTGLGDFRYPRSASQFFDAKIPAPTLAALHRSLAYGGRMPVGVFAGIDRAIAVAALAFLALLAATPVRFRGAAQVAPRVAGICAWIVVGVVVNAVVCGTLSGPHDRYSARVLWLIPLAALLAGSSLRVGRGGGRGALTAMTAGAGAADHTS